MTDVVHQPVLAKEVIELFQPKSKDYLLDATLGHGGHTRAFLEASGGTAEVIAFDADKSALAKAKENLNEFKDRIIYIHANFAQLKDSVTGGGILSHPPMFTHILFDLGIGSHQLADKQRGFSFQSPGKLTMRYGKLDGLPPAGIPALNHLQQRLGYFPDVLDLLYSLSLSELAQVIRTYGQERFAHRIAAALKEKPLPANAKELAVRIQEAVPKGYERGRINPATRTFQALRLAVNRELEALRVALPQGIELLKPAGIIAVISFHSLEDRIVKHFFRQEAVSCICPPGQPTCGCRHKASVKILTKKPIRPTPDEIARNSRSRSAKLRAVQKI